LHEAIEAAAPQAAIAEPVIPEEDHGPPEEAGDLPELPALREGPPEDVGAPHWSRGPEKRLRSKKDRTPLRYRD